MLLEEYKSHFVFFEGFVVELSEKRVGILKQLLRIVVLLQQTALKDQNSVTVDDSVQPVGNCDDCAVLESLVHSFVNDSFSSYIDVGGSFIY